MIPAMNDTTPPRFDFRLPVQMPTYRAIKPQLDQTNVFCIPDFFSARQIEDMVRAFYKAEPDWTTGFDGEQFALGEVWYHYAEEGENLEQYHAQATASRAVVEKHMPGLHAHIIRFLQAFLEHDNVYMREGWAGPGIVNFKAGRWVAQNGGSVHYDAEGLTPEDMGNPDFETYSFVAMLQKPLRGGNLQIWDKPYDHTDPNDQTGAPDTRLFPNPVPSVIDYKPTEMWLFNGLRAHWIEPFAGDIDRICLTFHIARRKDGWDVWF